MVAAEVRKRSVSYGRKIFSDSSLGGYGPFCEGETAQGLWKKGENDLNINSLDLMAAFIASKCFAADLKECEILIRVDNTAAKPSDIWNWCETRRLWIHPA